MKHIAVASALIASVVSFSSATFADDNDYIHYTAGARAVVQSDACAAAVVDQAVSKAIDIISDAGVDYPDYILIRVIDVQDGKYRVTMSGDMVMELSATDDCTVGAPRVFETIETPVRFDIDSLDELAGVADVVLGQEFFGPMNIGGAYTVASTWFSENNGDAASLVKAFYKEWRGVTATATLDTDESEAHIRHLLEKKLNIQAIEDLPETAAKAEEIRELVMLALSERARFKVVTGQWSDVGIGDPYANFIAIVDEHLGELLILEQGYVD